MDGTLLMSLHVYREHLLPWVLFKNGPAGSPYTELLSETVRRAVHCPSTLLEFVKLANFIFRSGGLLRSDGIQQNCGAISLLAVIILGSCSEGCACYGGESWGTIACS